MGIHILAEFHKCTKNIETLKRKSLIEKFALRLIKRGKLKVLHKHFHRFKDAGITGFILLAESHISVHTWPERDNSAILDIYVCNYKRNNSKKARRIFNEFRSFFKPIKVIKNSIKLY